MTLEELKREVENYEISCDYDRAICDLTNLCIDYENDTQKWDFEEILNRFVNAEIVLDYIQASKDLYTICTVLENIDGTSDYYYDEVYGFREVTKEDIEDMKRDILDTIGL